MLYESMNLKILLPTGVFGEIGEVQEILVESRKGSFRVMPNRLDFVAALVPGILTYKLSGGPEVYIAIDEGVITKAGADVQVSVRNAIGERDLGKLKGAVVQQFKVLDEREKQVQSVMAKLESSFIRQLKKLRQE